MRGAKNSILPFNIFDVLLSLSKCQYTHWNTFQVKIWLLWSIYKAKLDARTNKQIFSSYCQRLTKLIAPLCAVLSNWIITKFSEVAHKSTITQICNNAKNGHFGPKLRFLKIKPISTQFQHLRLNCHESIQRSRSKIRHLRVSWFSKLKVNVFLCSLFLSLYVFLCSILTWGLL